MKIYFLGKHRTFSLLTVSFYKINTIERGQEILFSLRKIKNDSVYYSDLCTSDSPS